MPFQPPANAGPIDDNPVPVTKHDDVELGLQKKETGRASVPISRAASIRSNRRSVAGTASIPGDIEGGDADDNISEYPWGPSHPCFPHPNPHVPLSSPLYEATRIIRIKRDWMVVGDLAPTFANLYPEILEPYISEDAFRDIIKHVNDELTAAFNPTAFRNGVDIFFGLATFWLWDDLGMTAAKKRLAGLEKWLDNWNREVGMKEAVIIVPLRRTGYLTLDIQIPDPHVGAESRPNTHNDDERQGDYAGYTVPPTLQVSQGSPVAV